MDKDISADIKTIKDPYQRILIRILFIMLFSAGTVIAFLYKGSAASNANEYADCKNENKRLNNKCDSLQVVINTKDDEVRERLLSRNRMLDSIIGIGKSIKNNNK